MSKEMSSFFICIVFDIFAIVIFSIIALAMYKATDKNEKKSSEIIFSRFLFLIYVIVFLSIIPLFVYGKKELGIVAFVLVCTILLSLLISKKIESTIHKKTFKKLPRFQTKAKIYSAKLCSVDVKSNSKNLANSYYIISAEYKHSNGINKHVQINGFFTLAQIAYLNSFKYIEIEEVEGIFSIINANHLIAPINYDRKLLSDIKIDNHNPVPISDITSSTQNKEIAIIPKITSTILLLAPIIIALLFCGLVLYKDNNIVKFYFCVASGITTLILILFIISNFFNIKKEQNPGIETFAEDFKQIGLTHTFATIYKIVYTYKTQNGQLLKKSQHVSPDRFEAIKFLKKLPIKVHGRKANIDFTRIHN